jgi:Homeodomain-like domain
MEGTEVDEEWPDHRCSFGRWSAAMDFLAHLRKSRRHALRQRAEILLASMVYTPVYQIALIFRTDEAYVRKLIHAFNEFGFDSLNPKVGTGRPKTFEPAMRERIVAVAMAPLIMYGEPLTHWSLRRLKRYLERCKIVSSISVETLRCILREKNVTFQRTRSWKSSTDPDFEAKATRIMALYRICPDDGVVVCFDEFGPVSLQPYPGGWTRRTPESAGAGTTSTAPSTDTDRSWTPMCRRRATWLPRAGSSSAVLTSRLGFLRVNARLVSHGLSPEYPLPSSSRKAG